MCIFVKGRRKTTFLRFDLVKVIVSLVHVITGSGGAWFRLHGSLNGARTCRSLNGARTRRSLKRAGTCGTVHLRVCHRHRRVKTGDIEHDL